MYLTFHPLQVAELRPEASDGLCIAFNVPAELQEIFRFSPGQHIGLRAMLGGQEVRRTYSICSGMDEPVLRVGVRVQDQGSMSQHLATSVRVGDVLDVMSPAGSFFIKPDATVTRTYCAFVAGSGITPVLGILNNVLKHEPQSRFIVFYGNRTRDSVMFAEELMALKDRYPQRLSLYFLLSREPQDVELLNGRLDSAKVTELAQKLFDPKDVDAYLLCGPGSMIESTQSALTALGVPPARIHSERFVGNTPTVPHKAVAAPAAAEAQTIHVSVVMDGRRRNFSMTDPETTLLEAAEEAGLELPYSCRAGVCSTCRVRVVRGEVEMRTNYALEPWETKAGYVLCCQAVPVSTDIELNYDDR